MFQRGESLSTPEILLEEGDSGCLCIHSSVTAGFSVTRTCEVSMALATSSHSQAPLKFLVLSDLDLLTASWDVSFWSNLYE